MKRLLTNFIWAILIVSLCVSHAYAKNDLQQNISWRWFIEKFMADIGSALDENLTDKEEFTEDFEVYLERMDSELTPMLEDFTNIIDDYAQIEGLEESSEELFKSFSELSQNLNQLISEYPRYDEVEGIILPLTQEFEETLISQFPRIQKPSPGENPLSGLYQFYVDSEETNPLNIGSFFKLIFLGGEERLKTTKEIKNKMTSAGFLEEKIILKETREFKDQKLVFYQKIVNDEVVEEFEVLDDLTFLHGLPKQMRNDQVDEKYVMLIEEYLKLINLHIINEHQNQGLIVNIDHPQLQIPDGYTPEEFVQNVVEIFIEFIT